MRLARTRCSLCPLPRLLSAVLGLSVSGQSKNADFVLPEYYALEREQEVAFGFIGRLAFFTYILC